MRPVNPLGLAWWCWLGILECAPPQGLRFDSLWCQFWWANLASWKEKKDATHASRTTVCYHSFRIHTSCMSVQMFSTLESLASCNFKKKCVVLLRPGQFSPHKSVFLFFYFFILFFCNCIRASRINMNP
jgi:hypothetical protein